MGLTEDEKKQVHPLLQKARAELKSLKADTTMDKKQKRQQVMAIRQNTNEQLKSILTPEQFQKLQALKEERKSEHKGRPSKGDKGAPAPATT